MLDRSVAERLRRLEITQTVFATLIGITNGALSLYLNGQANPGVSTEEKIRTTLAELERLSKLLPYLPSFRNVARVQALLLALRTGELGLSREVRERAVAAVSEEQSAPLQPVIPRPAERPSSDPPSGYQIRTP